jgi:Fe-S cluster biosynthesis and repair protein YggX
VSTITCIRCKESKEQLEAAPVGGPLGETIYSGVCVDCWNEWRETSARLINHYNLNLGLPDHRQELRRVMKEFLGLEPASTPPPA